MRSRPDSPKPRSDGEASRQRLMDCALRLFAEQGYAKTSIRRIADAAQANPAAVSYYFGNKAGLYRAIFLDGHADAPLRIQSLQAVDVDDDEALLRALRHLFACFLEHLKDGEETRLRTLLHRREVFEPTGVWQEKIDIGIRPLHGALVAMLCRRFRLDRIDADIQRLAFSITGQAIHLFAFREVIDAVAPGLLEDDAAIDAWGERLGLFAMAMIDAEATRRGLPRARPTGSSTLSESKVSATDSRE